VGYKGDEAVDVSLHVRLFRRRGIERRDELKGDKEKKEDGERRRR